MMILRSSPSSPFGRKIKIAASLVGLSDQIKVENADTLDPSDTLRSQNPLGKIPALILEDGEVIYDSGVILDSLDKMAGGNRLIPSDPAARRKALTFHALCDGLMDASLLIVYEKRMRSEEERSQKWLDYQAQKVDRTLQYLEANCPQADDAITIGHIGLACALGYRDLRFDDNWRATYPKLTAWLQAFSDAVPAFEKTKINP